MADIDKADFADQCVTVSLQFGVNAHYLAAAAMARSGLKDGPIGDKFGPYLWSQQAWNENPDRTNPALGTPFGQNEVADWRAQVTVFALMTRDAFAAFAKLGQNPSALELYQEQWPDAVNDAGAAAALQTACNGTKQAVIDAINAQMPGAAADVITDPHQPVPVGVGKSGGGGPSGGGAGGGAGNNSNGGSVGGATGTAVAAGTFNAKYNRVFTALVPGGFYSSDPDDVSVRRSLRTNNPGALNETSWQRQRPGYVGKTPDDGHGNLTTIYCAPEYGVAAWYRLLAKGYKYSEQGGQFSLGQLARSYAGADASEVAVDAYVNGWKHFADLPLASDTIFHLTKDTEMLALARAMFKHEVGGPLQITNAQILFGIQNERADSLPAPPGEVGQPNELQL